jgi:ubiquinone/menaquinone biosynthesis C-methylase UbiE
MRGTSLPMRPEGLAGRIFGRLMETLNAPAYELALRMLAAAPGESILEIGFGTGRLLQLLARRVTLARIAGVDPAATMVEVASARRELIALGDRVDLRLGEVAPLPWGDASFDAVLALHCFQFWPDPAAAGREIWRVLRPDGRMVLILRKHRASARTWLPNPLSRAPDELAAARSWLSNIGLTVTERPRLAEHALLARKPGTT